MKYVATRSGDVLNSGDIARISGKRSLASFRLSMAMHSVHCSNNPNSLRWLDNGRWVGGGDGLGYHISQDIFGPRIDLLRLKWMRVTSMEWVTTMWRRWPVLGMSRG